MSLSIFNNLFSSGVSFSEGAMNGPLGYVVAGILGLVIVITIIGLVFAVIAVVGKIKG